MLYKKQVKKNPEFIQSLTAEEQTEELCIYAVKRDPFVLKYVKKQTVMIAATAVSIYPDAIRLVDQTLLIKLLKAYLEVAEKPEE